MATAQSADAMLRRAPRSRRKALAAARRRPTADRSIAGRASALGAALCRYATGASAANVSVGAGRVVGLPVVNVSLMNASASLPAFSDIVNGSENESLFPQRGRRRRPDSFDETLYAHTANVSNASGWAAVNSSRARGTLARTVADYSPWALTGSVSGTVVSLLGVVFIMAMLWRRRPWSRRVSTADARDFELASNPLGDWNHADDDEIVSGPLAGRRACQASHYDEVYQTLSTPR
eukprot:TRINITY_DN29540_c0_g1_i1.p1 TRINITY_DN29540_c0_g1~~TRINITY_DN29540_c0_g1_i1.p1  ORF type:complete len:236 (-),score=21.25 TRINITY_DN29540_c0_g1_i1:99-806(-)